MENVFLFVPNVIGYARILLALVSLWLMPTSPLWAIACYVTSALLDAVDGYAARLLDQSTKLGAMLDMLTDRCATLCLLLTLAAFYPAHTFLLQLSAALDISSHWLHLHSMTMKGAGSHKLIDLSGNRILRYYYSDKIVLFLMCSGNELFYASLYLLHFTEGPIVPVLGTGVFRLLLWATGPICVAKCLVSCVQLAAAACNMAAIDQGDRELRRGSSTLKDD